METKSRVTSVTFENGSAVGRSVGLQALPALMLSLVVGSASAWAQPSGAFTPAGNMSRPRVAHTSTLLRDGRVLIAGGLSDVSAAEAGAELYDPSTGSFFPTGSMTVGRILHSATLLQDGRVLITGGAFGNGREAIAELYDPSTGTFTRTGDMTVGGGLGVLLADGRVLFVSFVDGMGRAELYDPSAGTFTAIGNTFYAIPADTATLLANGTVLITHAGDFQFGRDRHAEIYDPPTGTFSATGDRVYSDISPATLLPNGDVLFSGGTNDGDLPSPTAELYHPDSGIFAAIGNMNFSREGASATLLPDGRVLIAGGFGSPNFFGIQRLTSAELYNPATGAFTLTGSMATARELHRATLLKTGDVLITGGEREFSFDPLVIGPVSSAELYRVSGVGTPSIWTSTDIGNVGVSGTAVQGNGIWTVQGAGSDVWGPADAFHFVSRRVPDEQQTIVVRVDDLQNTHPFAKAGLMLRTSLEADAAMVILDLKPNGEIEFMYRPSTGADVLYVGGTFVDGPAWLRLDWGQKIGSSTLVMPAVSRDNLHWSVLSAGVPLPANGSFDAGIAVTSHDTGQLNTAHFAGLSQLGSAQSSHDIGSTGLTGSAIQDGFSNAGVMTIEAAGADVWGTADSFQFAHFGSVVSTTSGTLAVRVVGLQDTHPFAKAGLMVREGSVNTLVDFNLPPDAPSVILDAKPSGELEFMARLCAGCDTIYLGGAQLTFPGYISIEKNGSTFTARFGQDLAALATIGSIDVFMSEWIAGLAVTSHDVNRTTTAIFENLSFLLQ
jgi:hypothetical protein